MDSLVVPSSPNWYLPDIMACAPDNTIVYGSRQDIVVIKRTLISTDDVQIIARAHSMKVVGVNLNRNWGNPHKYAVTVAEDKIVKVWDIESLEKKSSDKHAIEDDSSRIVVAVFAGDNRVVSVSEKGTVFIWDIHQNQRTVLTSLFSKSRSGVTCMSVCPHATWLTAFGLKSGLIVVADLRKNGKVLYNLRGHSRQVLSLVWCPAPVNVFPSKPQNCVVEKRPECSESEDRRKQKSSKKQLQPWTEVLTLKTKCEDSKEGVHKREHFKVDEMLSTKSKIEGIEVNQESPITPSDTRLLPMDISHSTQKIQGKIFSAEDVNGTSSDIKGLEDSAASEDSRNFASGSSTDSDTSFLKRVKQQLNLDESLKIDSVSESSDVFHDAVSENVAPTGDSTSSPEVENWRTQEPVVVDEEPRKDFLLASSAQEPNIYIWRVGTDGRMQTFLTVPQPQMPKGRKRKGHASNSEKCWIVLCWLAPKVLLSSSRNHELLQWNLPKPIQQGKYPIVVHREHWSVLFSVKAPIVYQNEYDFLHTRALNAWTTGMERSVIDTDLESKQALASYPTFGGSANCIASSLVDPARIAIGSGEGLINIWNLSSNDPKVIRFQTLYQNILGSVTALAWHPSQETSLAWGTVEGRVGIFDVSPKNKKPKVLPHFFKSQIFKMEWGPLDSALGERKLFVVGEGAVAIFDPNSTQPDPETLSLPDNAMAYTMAWKPNYALLLVASKAGTLVKYAPDLSVLQVYYVSFKMQSILWHPNASTEISKYCNMFVSIVKSSKLVVFDLSSSRDTLEEDVANFDNRDVKITGVAWSPYFGNHLIWVDEQGVAQIGDIDAKIIISTYINPCLDPLLSVHWSPVDPNCIITGTTGHKLVVWKISQNPDLSDDDIIKERKGILKAQQKEVSDLVKIKSVKKSEEPKAKTPISQVIPLFYSFKEATQVADIKKLLNWKLGEDTPQPDPEAGQIDILDVFGDQMQKVIDQNLSAFRTQGAHHKANVLTLIQGDIPSAVKFAIANKTVSPWIISVAPMVSQKVWQEACETYVEQLLQQPNADALEIVCYMLVLHKVTDSIALLCDRQMFREAFVLARARFGPGGSIEIDILDKWAHTSVYQGNYELAACCYIRLGNFEKAASILFRRPDIETLGVAARLAELAGNKDLLEGIVNRKKLLEDGKETQVIAQNGVTEREENNQNVVDRFVIEESQDENLPEMSGNQKTDLEECGKAPRNLPSNDSIATMALDDEIMTSTSSSTEVVVGTPGDTKATEAELDRIREQILERETRRHEGPVIQKIREVLRLKEGIIRVEPLETIEGETEATNGRKGE